jgi:hypothetical protein
LLSQDQDPKVLDSSVQDS